MGVKKPYYFGSDVKSKGSFFSHDGTIYIDIELTAGMFKVVADVTARDAIPANKRLEGLVVYVASIKTKYLLIGGVDNTDWLALGIRDTFADGGNADIIVGNITRDYSVTIAYVLKRGTSIEIGTLIVTNKADVILSWNSEFDSCGITFTKVISGDDIIIHWNDDTSTGDDTEFVCSINRLMI